MILTFHDVNSTSLYRSKSNASQDNHAFWVYLENGTIAIFDTV